MEKSLKLLDLMIESQGPESSIGDVCLIHVGKGTSKRKIMAEVVGFKEQNIILMPYTNIQEIRPGSLVEATGKPLQIKVGPELIGKVVDSLGIPMDGTTLPVGMRAVDTDQTPPNPLSRPPISDTLEVGVRAIDSLLTVGKGQRLGIFAGSGVGKSTLLGMIAQKYKSRY